MNKPDYTLAADQSSLTLLIFRTPLIFAASLVASSADAARPMITDDARTVDPKACQVESWVRSNRDSTEYWALPACNFTGNLEVTFGGARTHDDSGTRTTDVVLQAKTLFRKLETNSWSWGLGGGTIRHPPEHGPAGDLYAYVPVTFSLRDDRTFVHTNIGWLRQKEDGRNRMTWGLGSETELTQRAWLIAEAYGQNEGRPFYQMGVRYWIVPNRVQTDATYGNRFGRDSGERWFSVGIRLLSLPFLP